MEPERSECHTGFESSNYLFAGLPLLCGGTQAVAP